MPESLALLMPFQSKTGWIVKVNIDHAARPLTTLPHRNPCGSLLSFISRVSELWSCDVACRKSTHLFVYLIVCCLAYEAVAPQTSAGACSA